MPKYALSVVFIECQGRWIPSPLPHHQENDVEQRFKVVAIQVLACNNNDTTTTNQTYLIFRQGDFERYLAQWQQCLNTNSKRSMEAELMWTISNPLYNSNSHVASDFDLDLFLHGQRKSSVVQSPRPGEYLNKRGEG